MEIKERIAQLRALMKERNIDIYYIPNEDDHLSSEYTADYFKCKSYMSGFTGDSGCTIVTQDFVGLWTDGRYFTQAENELDESVVTLMRMRQEGVMDPIPFVIANTPENGTVGFDGSVVSTSDAMLIQRGLKNKHAHIEMMEDLVGMVWKDRPAMPQEKLFVLDSQYTGETIQERIEKVRQDMENRHVDGLILTALEDPCWMLNIRGNDIPCTPVPYAYAYVAKDYVIYYVDLSKVNETVSAYFVSNGVTVKAYHEIETDLSALENQVIWVDLRSLNAKLYDLLSGHNNQILNEHTSVELYRAIKTPVEIENTIHAHVKDGVAMVKFIKWVKENVGKGDMTELSAQNYLYDRRAEQDLYIEPSFETICAYQANGAMMHYTATEDSYAHIDPKGFLLVDSGGTYFDGSTDITRTIAVGELTAEEKKLYTLVLKGHLDLTSAQFLYGTAGNNLDILARKPLWDMAVDYQCGTGHGVGHVLGVHEGPHGIRWGMPSATRPSHILEPGMIVTNEPGVYLPNVLGIRIENELLVEKTEKNFYGQWLNFKDLTVCPYDVDAIDPAYLDDSNIEEINEYHHSVYETLSPYLNEEEKSWLANATREISK